MFANIFISFIGAGILGMPHAFKEVCKVLAFARSYTVRATNAYLEDERFGQLNRRFLSHQAGVIEGSAIMALIGTLRYVFTYNHKRTISFTAPSSRTRISDFHVRYMTKFALRHRKPWIFDRECLQSQQREKFLTFLVLYLQFGKMKHVMLTFCL